MFVLSDAAKRVYPALRAEGEREGSYAVVEAAVREWKKPTPPLADLVVRHQLCSPRPLPEGLLFSSFLLVYGGLVLCEGCTEDTISDLPVAANATPNAAPKPSPQSGRPRGSKYG